MWGQEVSEMGLVIQDFIATVGNNIIRPNRSYIIIKDFVSNYQKK